jgi:hypothetical protein
VDPLTGPPPLPRRPRSGDETVEVVTPPNLEEGWSFRGEIERRGRHGENQRSQSGARDGPLCSQRSRSRWPQRRGSPPRLQL